MGERMKTKGFTLIELLVVIAIIALLLSIVMPGLNMAKQKAASAACLSNAKQLSVAWYMYTEDNDGRICSSHTKNKYGWVRNPIDDRGETMSNNQLSPAVTDEDEIRGIEAGVLFDYYEAADVMHCPADKIRVSKYDGTKIFRSYSMPAYLYPSDSESRLTVKRLTNITATGSRIMLVEEADGRNYNSGPWSFGAPGWSSGGVTVPQGEYRWWDPMAVNHGDASILGFCDGHAEVKKWQVRSTKQRIIDFQDNPNRKTYGLEDAPPSDSTVDVDYVGRAWGVQ
ncbi:MAG: type II secretion system protein [Planctomycetota bacterium]|jgi:prepilin-type N-terminal cleavage/methylation domain-containing protein/prepilin-type processing-associated H-X9-DG protein